MKNSLFTRACLLASVAVLNLSVSALRAQTPSNPPPTPSSPAPSTDTKSTDSTAEQSSGGSNGSQAQTSSSATESKMNTNSLDMNASQANTMSDDKSATKKPSDATTPASKKDDMPLTDATFTKMAAIGGMFEVEAGKLAGDKASSDKVKDFGSKMVEDHGKANDQLKSIASSKSIMVPDKLDAKHQAMYDKLSKLSGPAFDKAYLASMTKAHNKDLALFQKEAATTTDDQYKSFATDTTTVIQMHISMLSDIKSGMTK